MASARTGTLFLVLLLTRASCLACAQPPHADDVPGTWTGVALFRGQPLAITLRFERDRGFLRGTLSAPLIAILEQPLADVAHDSSIVYFALADADGALAFRGMQQGDTLSGTASLPSRTTASEGAPTMTWRVTRIVPAAVGARDSLRTRDLRIAAQDAILAATLFLPPGASRPAPAVLILQGSSSNLRDEYRFYAERFARAGFAVLAFDKRGNGASTGDYRRASYDDLVFDARAAFDSLAAQPEVDLQRVGIWGLSQGAFIAPRVAEHTGVAPAFVVAVSSPGVSIAESAAYQDSLRVSRAGYSDAQAASAVAVHRALARALRRHAPADRITRLFDGIATAPWRPVTSLPRLAPTADELGGWYWYGRTLDPTDWWRRLRTPVLLVYGDADELVPAGRSVERLERALRAGGNADVTVRRYPGANHVIKQVASPLAAGSDGWAWPVLAPGYLDATVAWMRDHASGVPEHTRHARALSADRSR